MNYNAQSVVIQLLQGTKLSRIYTTQEIREHSHVRQSPSAIVVYITRKGKLPQRCVPLSLYSVGGLASLHSSTSWELSDFLSFFGIWYITPNIMICRVHSRHLHPVSGDHPNLRITPLFVPRIGIGNDVLLIVIYGSCVAGRT